MHALRWIKTLALLGGAVLGLSACGPRTDPAPAGGNPPTAPAEAIRIPAAVSPELQAVIAALRIPPEAPAPRTDEEWRELQRTRDALAARVARASAQALAATVEEMEVGGVRCYLVTPNEIRAGYEDRHLAR